MLCRYFTLVWVMVVVLVDDFVVSFNFNRPMHKFTSLEKNVVNSIVTGLIVSLPFYPVHQVIAQQSNDLVSQLKTLQQAQQVLDSAELPFIELPNKISYREFREGRGTEVVTKGSLVRTEMTIRCESFKTGHSSIL